MFISGDYLAMASSSQVSIDIGQGNRRISTRSIKRKKFDDELVESSLIKSDRVRPKTQGLSESKVVMPSTASTSSTVTSLSGERIDMLPLTQPIIERKKVLKVMLLLYYFVIVMLQLLRYWEVKSMKRQCLLHDLVCSCMHIVMMQQAQAQ